MNENLLKVEIVIPVYNRCETTMQGLRSLSRIDAAGLEVHLIVVDDGSTDGTGAAVRKHFPDVQIIEGDGTLHYAAGTNRGITAALARKPDFILTANDDVIFHDQFLQRSIKTARENPHSIVGSLLLLWDTPHKVFQVGQKWKTFQGGWEYPENMTAFSVPQTAFEVESIVGNCVVFPVAAIIENGLMDEEKFPHGWGDVQYLVKMRKAGWQLLIEPKSYVWCEPNTNPIPLSQLPPGEIFRILFKNRRHPVNLQRQFMARWESAPTRLQAVLAFVIFCLRLFAKAFRFSPSIKN